MAIFSLNIRSIGRTTHAARTAGAHIRYITRPGAQAEVMAQRMPEERKAARRWLDAQERADRKNARVIDKITVALPLELNRRQRRHLVRHFADTVTKHRASWFAAIHQKGKDAHNPHAHLVIRDRDPATGKRVALLSEKGSCKKLRRLWEEAVNEALAAQGSAVRVSRLSHQARGIKRAPQRHRGPYRPSEDKGNGNHAENIRAPVRASMAWRAGGFSDGRRRQRPGQDARGQASPRSSPTIPVRAHRHPIPVPPP